MRLKFYRCNICGQIVTKIKEMNTPLSCCGEEMTLIEPNTVDGVHEKHIPVIVEDKKENTVTVTIGEKLHPSIREHYIEWICIETSKGVHFKTLSPGEMPEVTFKLSGGEYTLAAYAYCNIHGLWKKEIK